MNVDLLISVIIPVYNVKPYLEHCMDTVLNQTYRNLEIVLVDDGSTDGSGELCDHYQEIDKRVRVIHKTCEGVSSARNAALDVAKGEFYCFVDSDDYASTELVEKLMTSVQNNSCEIAICGHYTERNGKISVEEPLVDNILLFNRDEALDKLIEDKIINNYFWDKIYKKDLFDGVRFPVGRAYEDVAIQHLLFAKAKKICRIPECLYYYQKRSGSISDHFTDDRKWYRNCQDMLTAKLERFNFLCDRNKTTHAQKCMANLIPTIYEAIKLGHLYSDKEHYNQYMMILKKQKKGIRQNPFVSDKEKKLLSVYSNKIAAFFYCKLKNRK